MQIDLHLAIIGLENQYSVFMRVAVLHRFYCTMYVFQKVLFWEIKCVLLWRIKRAFFLYFQEGLLQLKYSKHCFQASGKMHVHALFYLTCTVTVCSVVSERKDLNILGLLPINGNLFRGGNACLIGANMALRHVNARDDILPSYKLNLIYEDTKVTHVFVFIHRHALRSSQ